MEGPSLYILKEEAKIFIGKKVLEAEGYANVDFDLFTGKVVKDIRSWGKHFLIMFTDFTVRVHFGLFGSYRLNENKQGKNASFRLRFTNGEINCYIAHIKIIQEKVDNVYDWRLDMLSEQWDPAFVKKKVLKQNKEALIGDVLLNPDIFSGVGNIIRNEVLYRTAVHPESKLKNIPSAKLSAVVKETHHYSFIFLDAIPRHEVGKTWQVYGKKECPKGHKVLKKVSGKTKRNVFICDKCQKKYTISNL